MQTNAGEKMISEKGTVEGFGEVWFDNQAIRNIFSLSDVVQKGFRVVYDSDVSDEFVVYLRNERTIRFPSDKRGLYVKETYDQMQKRLV